MSNKDAEDNDDDTYSTVFSALKHPIRRRILRIIDQSPVTYTELLNELGIENGLLNYHLENLRELVAKDEQSGKYRLSEFGKAAVGLTRRVEEPRDKGKSQAIFGLTPVQLKALLIVLVVTLGSVSGYFAYAQLWPKPAMLVSGIVQAKDEINGVITLRLLVDDTLNGAKVEQIHNYTAKGSDFYWAQGGDIVTVMVNRESNATIMSIYGPESHHLTAWVGGSSSGRFGGMSWGSLSPSPTPASFTIHGGVEEIEPYKYVGDTTMWLGVVVHSGETISYWYTGNASVALSVRVSNSPERIGDSVSGTLLVEQSGPNYRGTFNATVNSYLTFTFEPDYDGWAAVTFDGMRTLSSGSTLRPVVEP